MKLFKFIEIAYLLFAVFFIYNAITTFSIDNKKALLFLLLAIAAIFMFFFKRWFRKNRFENRK